MAYLNIRIQISLLLTLLIFVSGCTKLIEIKAPTTSINEANVYSADGTATAVLTGIYTKISSTNSAGFDAPTLTSIGLFTSLSADELALYSINSSNLYRNYYLNSLNNTLENPWYDLYSIIFNANAAIEGVTNSSSLTEKVKNQLLGEAKFIRSFCYFYLVNLFGDVPLVKSTNPNINLMLSRSSIFDIYQFIINDLIESRDLLSENYLDGSLNNITNERVRPTKWAANSLLARVYLYNGDYINAEASSTIVINGSSLFELVPLNDVFLMNSREAIWQLQPVTGDVNSNTGDGKTYILPDTGPNSSNHPVYLSKYVMNRFEEGDERKSNWTNSVTTSDGTSYYFPYKYKIGIEDVPVSEYIMVMRLAEQYLIRAEARIQQQNILGATADLNLLRLRAGLLGTTATNKDELLNAIMHERQVELFTEWGNRWFDLKRTGAIDSVMAIITAEKGGNWDHNWKLYPLKQIELERGPNLVQNAGY